MEQTSQGQTCNLKLLEETANASFCKHRQELSERDLGETNENCETGLKSFYMAKETS